MRIDDEAVRVLDPVEDRSYGGRGESGPTVGPVDMQPHPALGAGGLAALSALMNRHKALLRSVISKVVHSAKTC